MKESLRIGTRGSPLALQQTDMVAEALRGLHPGLDIEISIIKTSGDWVPAQGETRLAEAEGGKGLFAREIEQAILSGGVDCGVHSMKDMPSFLPEGLAIRHVLTREDPRDALLTNTGGGIEALKPGAVVGTSSLRRQAMLLALRPDLKVVPFRGNVQTRIDKLRAGQVDATILAMAGLKRLGLEHEISAVLEPEDFLPASGQGIVGIEIRAGDHETAALLDGLHCKKTGLRLAAERAVLEALEGSCRTPVGAYAVLEGEAMFLRVLAASSDGTQMFRDECRIDIHTREEAEHAGRTLGLSLKDRLPAGILC